MKVDVTFLVENTAPTFNLCAEYGQGMLVKVDDHLLIFDVGHAGAAAANLKTLGIQPEAVHAIVISHGHLDHTRGLLPVLEVLGSKDIYIHADAFYPKFAGLPGTWDIGMPKRETIENAGGRIIHIETPTEILPKVWITGAIPRETDFEDVGGLFAVQRGREQEKDELTEELALVIDHPNGLIVISGCAHAGMINTIEYARRITGNRRVLAWVGGTHLVTASTERLTRTFDRLKEMDLETIVVSHCTGFVPAALMYSHLGSSVRKGETGQTFTFD